MIYIPIALRKPVHEHVSSLTGDVDPYTLMTSDEEPAVRVKRGRRYAPHICAGYTADGACSEDPFRSVMWLILLVTAIFLLV